MPKIPTYQSRLGLTTQPPGVARRVEPDEVTMRALQSVGESVFQLGQRIAKADAERQYLEGAIRADEQFRQIEYEATNDNELDGFTEKYENKLSTTRDTVLNGIRSPVAREKLELILRRDALDYEYRIKNLHTKKLVDRSKAALDDNIEIERRNYFLASSPSEKEKVMGKMASMLNASAENGIITFEKARDRFSDIKKNITKDQVEYDMRLDPVKALERLKTDVYGLKKENPTLWAELKEDAEGRVKKLMKEKSLENMLAQDQTEQGFVQKAIAGELTEEEIDEAEVRAEAGMPNGVSKDFASAMRRLLKSQKAVDPTISVEKYATLAEEFMALNIDQKGNTDSTIKDLAKFRKHVVDAMAKGEITREEGRGMMKDIAIPFNTEAEELARKKYAQRKKALGLARWWRPDGVPKRILPQLRAAIQRDIMNIPDVEKMDDETLFIEANKVMRESFRSQYPTYFDKHGFMQDEIRGNWQYIGDNKWQKRKQ